MDDVFDLVKSMYEDADDAEMIKNFALGFASSLSSSAEAIANIDEEYGEWFSAFVIDALNEVSVLDDSQKRNVFIRYADLNVIRRQHLVVAHVILLHAHESGGMIGFRIAVSPFTAYVQLLLISFQFPCVSLKLLISTLLYCFVPAFAMNEAVFIQSVYLRIR